MLGVALPKSVKLPNNVKLAKDLKVPKELKPENLLSAIDVKKLSGKVDYKDVLKRVGDAAEAIEARSDDVRMVSGQAKRLSRKLS
jgi:hypothetical protein